MGPLPESLVQIVQALADDEDLALWFENLEGESAAVRTAEFRRTAARMSEASPDAALAHAISLLAVPGMYESVLAALRELRGG